MGNLLAETANALAVNGKSKRKLLDAPPAVIKRWSRLRNLQHARKLSRMWMRIWLPYKERKRRAASESAFATAKYYAHKNENGNLKALSLLFNVGLYLLIADKDIQSSKIDALTHPDEWRRKLAARVILLTIYEWNADDVTGRDLRDAMELMLIPEDLRKEATIALRKLRGVQEKAQRQFAFIRNVAIAHRDSNALTQYRAIRDLDVQQVMLTGTEFYGATQEFMSVLTKLMLAGNTLQSYARQWDASNKAKPLDLSTNPSTSHRR